MTTITKAYTKQLSQAFKTLDGLLYIDPEDLDETELLRIFQEALSQHDYSYDMSDDHSVYMRGKLELTILQETVSRHKDLLEGIWQAYWKDKNKEWN